MNKSIWVLALLLFLPFTSAQNLPNAPTPQPASPNSTSIQKASVNTTGKDTGWPRTLKAGSEEFIIYQPQVDKWNGNRIYLYSAVQTKTSGKNSSYGVIWFDARTEVDKVNRAVTLDSLEVSKVFFPAAKEQEAQVLALLTAKLPGKTRTISLDRLEAAVKASAPKVPTVNVKNDPPRIIMSTKPSLLVTIDGQPKLAPIQKTDLQRVINTSAVLPYYPDKKKYFLRVMDWWLEAPSLDDPWTRAKKLPGVKKAEEYIAKQTKAQSPEPQQATGQDSSTGFAGNRYDGDFAGGAEDLPTTRIRALALPVDKTIFTQARMAACTGTTARMEVGRKILEVDGNLLSAQAVRLFPRCRRNRLHALRERSEPTTLSRCALQGTSRGRCGRR